MSRLARVSGLGLWALGIAAWLAPAGAGAADPEAGKQVYMTNCVSCHGEKGKGDGPVGAALTPSPRDFTEGDFKFDTNNDGKAGTDEDLANVIKNGAAAYGGSPLMAPWGHLGDEDIANLVAFIRSLQAE